MATAESQPGSITPSMVPLKRKLVNIFISVHLLFIIVWAFPVNTRPLVAARNVITPYMNFSGLNQAWNLFAPEPQSINAYLVAEITYRDGSMKRWKFPVPQDFGYFRRYFMARQLKWSADSLRLDSNATLWPDAARYVAANNNDPNNPPVKVALVRYWTFIAPPTAGQPAPINQYKFFDYTVLPGDLQ